MRQEDGSGSGEVHRVVRATVTLCVVHCVAQPAGVPGPVQQGPAVPPSSKWGLPAPSRQTQPTPPLVALHSRTLPPTLCPWGLLRS